MMTSFSSTQLVCYSCGCDQLACRFDYGAAPQGETQFSFSQGDDYQRSILECERCHHMISQTSMDLSEMYSQDYVDSTYGQKGILKTYQRIINLPPAQSDNFGRCDRVDQFCRSFFNARQTSPSVLDVGSGLCVFLHEMKRLGWQGTALDPDERTAEHARSVVGVNAICGDFFEHDPDQRFDLVTFNKVLEHVPSPIEMLRRTKHYLNEQAIVYFEVPDGEMAARAGQDREEFFVEHLHVFSMQSACAISERAGFDVLAVERLQEPSSKYTIRVFLTCQT